MHLPVAQLLSALCDASSLFLVAAGLTVIFGVTRIVNFAHGSLCMLGAYIAWSLLHRLPQGPLWLALGILGAAVAVGAIGILLEVTLLRRLYHAPELLQLLATFGVMLVVQDVTLNLWGPDDLSLPRPPWLRATLPIGGTPFPIYDLVLLAAGPIVLGLLWLLFQRTRWGIFVRAATLDREMVGALGVNQRLLFTSVFALGAVLAGLGGALPLPDASANLNIDLSVITDAFVVVVVGGMGSLTGAYVASLMISLLQTFGIMLIPKVTLVLVFLFMAVVLVVRPNGLFGRRQILGSASKGESYPLVGPTPRLVKLLGLALLLLAAAAPFYANTYLLSVLTETLIAILFAASLHLLMGPGGLPSFGHAAWFGLGAYGAALATTALSTGMPAALLLAMLTATVGAAACSFVVRLSGVYFAMLTLAFAQILWAIVFQSVALTGGDNGILGLWPSGWASSPSGLYWLVLLLCVAGALLLRRILYAPFGYALRAARDSSSRAEAIGLAPAWLRAAAFVIAGTAAGLAGGLYAFAKGSVFPDYLSISRSVDALIMVLLGGVQTVSGPILGAIGYTGLSDELLSATHLWRLVLGLCIILLVLVFPEGIAGTIQRLRARG